MSIAATLAAARRELAALHTATCELRTAASSWAANPSSRVACHYEVTPPAPGGPLEYETGGGYGYTVWFDEPATAVNEKDLVVIIASPRFRDVGMKLQVLSIPPIASSALVDKVETVKRDG